MDRILVVCPQVRDHAAIRASSLDARYRFSYAGEDLDAAEDFDPVAFLAACDGIEADGVIGTKDRSALLASLAAERKGLPGPTPTAVVACQVKSLSRRAQREAVPEATPRFAELDTDAPPEPPFFAKPAVGRLSRGARRIEVAADLLALAGDDPYVEDYARMARLAGIEAEPLRGYLAEELLSGLEVTLEGYVFAGQVTTIGATDSRKYEGTNSFERFEYPSSLSDERLAELADVARRLLPALGFDGGFFNVEFFVPEDGRGKIVEVNGRLASQFAPLVAAVQGHSTYDALVELACGRDPDWRAASPDGVAISYCLRVFEDALVRAVPAEEEGLEILVRPGLRLSEQGVNDVQSFRLAIFTEVGETRREALARCRERARSLAFELDR